MNVNEVSFAQEAVLSEADIGDCVKEYSDWKEDKQDEEEDEDMHADDVHIGDMNVEDMHIEDNEKEEVIMCVETKNEDALDSNNCDMEVDEAVLMNNKNEESKLIMRKRKRKWINLTKSGMNKFNDLDYS